MSIQDFSLQRFASKRRKPPPDPIAAGKDADFLVFDKDLLTAEKEGFSYNLPEDVYFAGKKVN